MTDLLTSLLSTWPKFDLSLTEILPKLPLPAWPKELTFTFLNPRSSSAKLLEKFPRNTTNSLEYYISQLRRLPAQEEDYRDTTQACFPLVAVGVSVGLHVLAVWGFHTLASNQKSSLEKAADLRREELVSEAQQALERRKSGKISPQEFGQFLVRSESLSPEVLSDADTEYLQKEWMDRIARDAESIEKTPNPRHKLYRQVTNLYWDKWQNYGRKFSNLIDYFKEGKGNCVAQSKLILAALAPLVKDLPSNQAIGIQIYRNHVQPVLYRQDPEGKILEVQNLVTGKIVDKVVAPIYDPFILYVGFLKKQGESSPLSFEDLLIARPASEDLERAEIVVAGYDPDEVNMEFPPSEAIAEDPGNEEALLDPPEFFGTPATPSAPIGTPGTGMELRLFEDLPHSKRPPILDFEFRNPYLYFRKEAQQQEFLSLTNNSDRRRYLMDLAIFNLKKWEQRPDFQNGRKLLEDPYVQLKEMSPENIREATLSAENYLLAINDLEYKVTILAGSTIQESIVRDRERRQFFPLKGRIGRQWTAFAESYDQDATPFFTFINQLPSAQRLSALFFTDHGPGRYHPSKLAHKWLVDSSRIGVAPHPNQETVYFPPGHDVLIDVELGDFPLPPSIDGTNSTPPIPGKILISPDAMIDSLLHYASGRYFIEEPLFEIGRLSINFYSRWDEQLSLRFKKLNSDGSRDQEFVDFYWRNLQGKIVKENAKVKRYADGGVTATVDDEFIRGKLQSGLKHPLSSPYLPRHMRELMQDILLRRGQEFVLSQVESKYLTNPSP